jgi:hypothetical protein
MKRTGFQLSELLRYESKRGGEYWDGSNPASGDLRTGVLLWTKRYGAAGSDVNGIT